MERNFTVEEEDSGSRIDLFLAVKIGEGYSRTAIQRIISSGAVLLNNGPVKPCHKVVLGDSVRITLPEAKSFQLIPQDIDFKIVYEDEDILVIDKPSGLVVHPGSAIHQGTLVNGLIRHTGELSNINPARPGIVHRLDKDTSGLMVIARNNSAHLNLVKQFSRHRIKKKYIALVQGVVELDEGIIDLPIGRHKKDFRRQAVRFIDSKKAVTRYRVLKRFKEATLLELIPKTGRTHQLRVHLAHIGYPILGDVKYGKKSDFPRLALHAAELGFFHPRDNKFVSFSSPLPEVLAQDSSGELENQIKSKRQK